MDVSIPLQRWTHFKNVFMLFYDLLGITGKQGCSRLEVYPCFPGYLHTHVLFRYLQTHPHTHTQWWHKRGAWGYSPSWRISPPSHFHKIASNLTCSQQITVLEDLSPITFSQNCLIFDTLTTNHGFVTQFWARVLGIFPPSRFHKIASNLTYSQNITVLEDLSPITFSQNCLKFDIQ